MTHYRLCFEVVLFTTGFSPLADHKIVSEVILFIPGFSPVVEMNTTVENRFNGFRYFVTVAGTIFQLRVS